MQLRFLLSSQRLGRTRRRRGALRAMLLVLSLGAAGLLRCGEELPDVQVDLKRYEVILHGLKEPAQTAQQGNLRGGPRGAALAQCRDQFNKQMSMAEQYTLMAMVFNYSRRQVDSLSNPDSLIAHQMCLFVQDTSFYNLVDDVLTYFPKDYGLEAKMRPLFARLRKHFPEYELPQVRTIVYGSSPERHWQQQYVHDRVHLSSPVEIRLQPGLGGQWRVLPEGRERALKAFDDRKPARKFARKLAWKRSGVYVAYDSAGKATERKSFAGAQANYLSIGLDYFCKPYLRSLPADLPRYLRRRCRPAFLRPAVANEIAQDLHEGLSPTQRPTLLAKMVNQGIRQYIAHRLVPEAADSLLLGYSSTEMKWARKFEADVYSEMQPLLFEQNPQRYQHFVEPGPFTQSFSRESPAQTSKYIGWRIVEAYMADHSSVTLRELAQRRDYRELFQAAAYKP